MTPGELIEQRAACDAAGTLLLTRHERAATDRIVLVRMTDTWPALATQDNQPTWLDMSRVDLSILNSGVAPVLLNHSRAVEDLVGVIEKAWIDDEFLFGIIRFGSTRRCDEVWQLVQDRVLANVSLGMWVWRDPAHRSHGAAGVKLWTPYEVSLVTVPASWRAQILTAVPALLPAHIRQRFSDRASASSGSPESWRAFVEREAHAICSAAEGRGINAGVEAMRQAVALELMRLADAARAEFAADSLNAPS